MDPLRILEKANKRFTLDHLKNDEVEPVSVLALDELDALITTQVTERTSQLAAELKHVRKRLQELEAEQSQAGGLERAAADAALEAEARALEAKAAAELRAEQAEARARDLEGQLAAATAGAAESAPAPAAAASPVDDGKLAALEEQARALEGQLTAERARADEAAGEASALGAKVAELEAALEKAKSAGGGDDGPAEPVTPDDHKRARRLVDALLDDIVNEDEDRARQALKARAFKVNFASELETARRQYVKRVKAAVRGDQDHWNEAIDALEAKANQ